MNHAIKTGFSFGLTSGIITTLGLMVGIESSTQSKIAVIGAILTIAIADAFSDALGIHVSEEFENVHSEKEVWQSTISTFLTKLIMPLIFIIPLLLFTLFVAVLVNVFLGLFLLALFSFAAAKSQKTNTLWVVGEHLFIAALVVSLAHYLGLLIAQVFPG